MLIGWKWPKVQLVMVFLHNLNHRTQDRFFEKIFSCRRLFGYSILVLFLTLEFWIVENVSKWIYKCFLAIFELIFLQNYRLDSCFKVLFDVFFWYGCPHAFGARICTVLVLVIESCWSGNGKNAISFDLSRFQRKSLGLCQSFSMFAPWIISAPLWQKTVQYSGASWLFCFY